MKIQDCKESIDAYHGERYVILVRSGFINQYHFKKTMYICEGHRYVFGVGFHREMNKKKKCVHPEHETGKPSDSHVTMEQSKAWLDKNGRIVPYGGKLCKPCTFKMSAFIKTYTKEKEEARNDEVEDMDSEDLAGSSQSQQVPS